MPARTLAILVLPFCLALAACGFQPLYGERGGNPGTMAEMARIEIAPIPDRIGLTVRNHLIDLLTPAGPAAAAAYRLDVKLHEEREGVAIRRDLVATRFNYRLTGSYRLIDASSGAVLAHGEARSTAAYNVVDSPYATLVSEQDAAARAARELSDSIRLRIALYFDRRHENNRNGGKDADIGNLGSAAP
jgi:LPS-assembly lipoprotein